MSAATADAPKLGQFSQLQKGLAAVFKGDPVISNRSRVMRLPGFYHNKKEPVLVTCLNLISASLYPDRYSEGHAACHAVAR
ncbi:MAG: hypothetical protein CVU99_06840 [Firmicutes bacterium HGW-Firmicutes-4]|nr:MAG: hypothetical protein CVU99_06840 [Firmicutes bacterium HGW-Firmicutes-4]